MRNLTYVSVEMQNGKIEQCTIKISDCEPWSIVFNGAGYDGLVVVESDLFRCLAGVRKRLESNGCKLLCKGARKDVYPSRMSRSMGGGKKAYLMKLGESATELLNIFDYASSELIVTVAEQQEFYREWINSLGSG